MEIDNEILEGEEIDIFVVDEEDKKYMLEISQEIKCIDLMKIIESCLKKYFFDIVYKDKLYNKNEIMKLEQGDIVHIIKNQCNCEEAIQNIKKNIELNKPKVATLKLSGILRLFLLKYISINLDDISVIKSEKIKDIIYYIKNGFNCSIKPKENIRFSMGDRSGKNILSYINYINNVIDEKEIKNLINLFDDKQKKEILYFWSILSEYHDSNNLFQIKFLKVLEKSYFDYSLIGVSLYEQPNKHKYLEEQFICQNCLNTILFSIPQTDLKSNIISDKLLYSRKPFYGMGIYFSEKIDYISFNNGISNNKKIIPIYSTFNCIATEIYYNKQLAKIVNDSNYFVKELDHFPNYEEIKKDYKDKAVEKNGLHIVKVEPNSGQMKNINEINSKRKEGKYIGTEYVITELEQMMPLYGLTIKRNEYFVIWRDPNFKGDNKFSKFLEEKKMFIYENTLFNSYFVSSTEKALEIIKRKKFNKIILISNIGLDLSGKRLVEVARKILGFDIVVLFFSSNKDHLKWIQNFPNALITCDNKFYEEYIKNYNEEGLLNLKKKIENSYKIKLKFTDNFFEFPKFINEEDYKDLIFEENSENFKKVIIKSIDTKNVLKMDKNGKVSFIPFEGKEIANFLWDVIIYDNEITFFSNNYYLGVNKDGKTVCGEEFMKRWKFEKTEYKYIFYFNKNNMLLTESDNNPVIKKKHKKQEKQVFKLTEYT